MSDDKSMGPFSELSSSAYLLKRLEEDIKAIHSQMAFLEIACSNLKGSWLAIDMLDFMRNNQVTGKHNNQESVRRNYQVGRTYGHSE